MEYPHRRYLVYLLTQRLGSWELLEQCRVLGLTPPNEEILKDIRLHMDLPPVGWGGKYTRKNVAARRWLRDLGIEDLWKGSAKAVQAEQICLSTDIRRDVQSLLLLHNGDGETVRESLLLKYPERLVPSAESISYFSHVFWDTRSMTRDGFLEYIKLSDDYERLLVASQGDIATAMSMMGIQSAVTRKAFLQTVVSFAQQQIVAYKRALQGNPLKGSDLIGLATFTRQGVEAVGTLEEIEGSGGVGDELVEEAQRFKLSRLQARQEIISIDDLEKLDFDDEDGPDLPSLEDAEDPTGEIDNVRQFPLKNS